MDPVLVLDAAMTVGAARASLALADARTITVVRRRDPRATGAMLWYPLGPDDLVRVLDPNIPPEMPLGVSLDLHEHGAGEARQLGDAEVRDGTWTGLVVDGSRAVGWVRATETAGRGVEVPPPPPPPPPLPFDPRPHWAPGDRLPMAPPPEDFQADPGEDVPATAEIEETGAEPPDGAEPPADTNPPDGAEPPADTVPAYPKVDVPEEVAPGAAFDVVVGLSRQAQAGVRGNPVAIPRDTLELTVQIKAENFTVPHIRHTLAVDLTDLEANTLSIPVVAPIPADLPWRGRIEIEYSAGGLLIGSAWRELVVTAQAPAQAPISTSGGEVAMEMDRSVPIDLTVSISRGEADGTFLWTFTTPHPVTLPDEQVITRLEQDTAETFALRKVREMAQVDGSPTAELRIAGVAREVAAVMPLWFWKVLAPVWRIAADAGRRPTVLLVSQEALVPWELATTDADYIVDRTLVDEAAPQVLGAQVALGRWRPAGPETPSGVRRPSTSPAERIAVGTLAVVVGEFGPSSGMRALKEAIAEGQALTSTYPAVWVKGTADEVATLLKGRLTDRGLPVTAQVLHVASHGEADPDSPINAGVILSDSSVRIDESIVAGSEFARTAAPLVFLNACQLASDSGGSLVEGGLAAAFLQAGARAFIAPLWSIDDTIAKDTALAFYAEALGSGRPVGEVMRALRARFTTAFPKRDQTTPLAYTYYGHPGLLLTREP